MKEREELELILKLIGKYNLPLSPILEYAVKERMEQLSSINESNLAVPATKPQERDGMTMVSINPLARGKRKPSTLRVVRANGIIIERENAANTFSQAIKEIGAEKVYALKIPMDNMYLVTLGGNPQYPTAQHDVGNGYFVNVHSNTVTKKHQLEKIFKAFNLSWTVEIVETK